MWLKKKGTYIAVTVIHLSVLWVLPRLWAKLKIASLD